MIRITGSVINFTYGGDGAMGLSCAFDLKVAGSSPAEQLQTFPKVNFQNDFQFFLFFQKLRCRHCSPVPRPCDKVFVRRLWCCFL